MHKFVAGALATGLVVVVAVFSLLLLRTWREYSVYQTREAALEQSMVRAQADRGYKQAYLNKLLTDPAFFERVARERLGYSREDEMIIRFEED
ncbi:MAG: FtsB family cell division protein [Puniceicoccales bacterium]